MNPPRVCIGFLWIGISICAAAAPPHVPGRLLAGRRAALDSGIEERVWRANGVRERRHAPELGLHILDVAEGSSDAIRESLRKSGLFDYVEPDYYAVEGGSPNDSYYGSQWHLPKIGGAAAWSLTTGSSSVVIAVIDSGIYPHHPDLESKLIPGWNFVKANADTADVTGHGTAVAGTAAAATNNGIGVAGVTWASLVMPLVVVDSTSFAAYSDIAAAIHYAVDRQVRVLNISIGGTATSTTLQNAVDYAWSHGALIFAAAMNSASTTPNYPAACNHAIAVSATTESDRLATFSNYGNWLTLSAPGTDILTTMDGGGYGYEDGTSFASPIAAAVAALVLAVAPQLTNEQVREILKQSADQVGQPGYDQYFGWGRVNAARAVELAAPAPSPAATSVVRRSAPFGTPPPRPARR